MFDADRYGLTTEGRQQIQGGATTVGPLELELLVRIDPQLTVAQLRAATPQVPAADFDRVLDALRTRRLIARVEPDPFDLQFTTGIDPFTPPSGDAAADPEAAAGLRSLRRAGYYVRIARRGAAAAPPAGGGRPRVAVIEDDPNLSKFIASYLVFEGFDTAVAANRAEALALLRQPPVPALVLLDLVLPDTDGFAILASLRRHPAFREVPVILLTGRATRESVLQGLALGADGYVTKPFEPDAMMTAVRTVLGTGG